MIQTVIMMKEKNILLNSFNSNNNNIVVVVINIIIIRNHITNRDNTLITVLLTADIKNINFLAKMKLWNSNKNYKKMRNSIINKNKNILNNKRNINNVSSSSKKSIVKIFKKMNKKN